jgi:hypothetical protein
LRTIDGAYDDIHEAVDRATELGELELLIDAQLYLVEVLIERRLLFEALSVSRKLLERLRDISGGRRWEASALLMAARAARACGSLRSASDYIQQSRNALDEQRGEPGADRDRA